MKRALRWFGYVLGGVAVIAIVFVGAAFLISQNRLSRVYEIEVIAPAVPTDAASIAEGERLVASRGCTDCHGADLGGQVMMDDPMMATLWSTNLTTGEGGIGSRYSDEDLVRAIWYGVDADGRALAMMPSSEYHQSIDEHHMALMLAYLRSAPVVDRAIPERRAGPLLRIFHTLGAPFFPVERIDTSAPPIEPVEIAATAEYGATLGVLCSGCHGADLAGFSDPGVGTAPNLTPHESGLGGWSFDDFDTTLRTGVRPDGSELGEGMPWQVLARTTDVEMEALWAYLSSLEPLPSAVD